MPAEIAVLIMFIFAAASWIAIAWAPTGLYHVPSTSYTVGRVMLTKTANFEGVRQ